MKTFARRYIARIVGIVCLLSILLIGRLWAATPVVTVVPSDGHILLSWDPAPVATHYEVRRFLDGVATTSPTPTPMATLSAASSLVYDDAGVTNGRRYRYEVTMWDALGPQAPSTLIAEPYALPATVTTVTVSTAYSKSLSLSWDKTDTTYPISYYLVYRYACTMTPTFTPSGPSPTSTHTMTATHTPTDTLTGPQSPTSTFTFTTTPSDTPTMPPLPPLLVTSVVGASSGPYTSTSASFLDDGVATPGIFTYYCYWVRAVDDHGVTGSLPVSTSIQVVPSSREPHAPSLSYEAGPSVTPVGTPGFGVRLLWARATDGEGVTGYTVLRNGTPVATLTPGASATLIYEDLTKDPSELAYQRAVYHVLASNVSGAVTSNSVAVTLKRAVVPGS